MTDTTPGRIFSEDEVGKILKRASEMQGDVPGKPSFGLTLDELEQLARDADIDPRFISAAAIELSGSGEDDQPNAWGGPLTLTLKRRIEGTISEQAWEEMVSRARKRFKKSGITDERGNTREWSLDSKSNGAASVSLHERDGYTEMEVFWHEEILPVPFLVIPFVLCLISIPIIVEEIAIGFPNGLFLWMAVAATLVTISRLGFGAAARRERAKVRSFGDSLLAVAEEARARETISREQSGAREDVPVDTRAAAPSNEARLSLEDPGPETHESDRPAGRERA